MQKVNERDCAFRGGDWGVKYFMRGPKLDWGLILLKPGQAMGEHGHKEVEETFYVLEGTPTLVVDGRRIRDRAGRRFPAGTAGAARPLQRSRRNPRG